MNRKSSIVSVLVLIAIAGSIVVPGISQATPGYTPVVVTNTYWYSQNSTLLVSPGSDYVPLFAEFTVAGSFTYVHASINLTYYSGTPFSYSYVNGPNQDVRSYYNLTDPTPGSSYSIVQLVNVSNQAAKGIYTVALEVTTNASPVPYYQTFSAAVLGTPDLTLVNYYTNPPIIYQDEKFVQLTAVVSNTGAGPAKNLIVGLTSSSFNVLTNQYNISYFPSGTIENFTFMLNAKNITGDAPVTLNIGQASYIIPLYLHGYGSVSIQSSIPVLTPGSSKLLEEFNITNTGNKTLYFVNVHLLSPSVVSIHISSSNPLGALTADNFTIAKLLPGQTVTATYIVDVDSSASPQTYPAQLVVLWNLNNTPQQFSVTYNFNEKVSPTFVQQFTASFTFTPLNIAVLVFIIALVTVIAAFSVRSSRSKKKAKKPDEKIEEAKK